MRELEVETDPECFLGEGGLALEGPGWRVGPGEVWVQGTGEEDVGDCGGGGSCSEDG